MAEASPPLELKTIKELQAIYVYLLNEYSDLDVKEKNEHALEILWTALFNTRKEFLTYLKTLDLKPPEDPIETNMYFDFFAFPNPDHDLWTYYMSTDLPNLQPDQIKHITALQQSINECLLVILENSSSGHFVQQLIRLAGQNDV